MHPDTIKGIMQNEINGSVANSLQSIAKSLFYLSRAERIRWEISDKKVEELEKNDKSLSSQARYYSDRLSEVSKELDELKKGLEHGNNSN